MPSVGITSNYSLTSPNTITTADNALLFATLGFSVAEKRPRLKAAARFTAWLAGVDIIAACIIVWEAAMAVSGEQGLGGSKGGASRLYVSCTIRPTLLLVVAVLSYANVVQGRSIALGKLDWIVWGPAVCILALGAGLASLPRAGDQSVWIGLVAWLSAVTVIVSFCFGRLLVAILRVRASTQRHHAASPWTREQERMTRKSSSTYRSPASYLPPLHSNFSGLSTSFVQTLGRSTSTLDLSSATMHEKDIIRFSSSNIPAVGYAPSRPSDDYDRDFRSPTPGSTMGLLRPSFDPSSPLSAPSSAYSQTPKADRYAAQQFEDQQHEIISFEEIPRPSMGSYASASTGGFVGGPAMRQAITQEVWGDSARASPMPGSGSPRVELSSKETRGALIRLGGHLLCSLFGYALVSPFLFLRIISPSSTPSLAASILLVAGVCQSGCILAFQTAMSEGLFFSSDKPPVLTSSYAATLEGVEHGEMVERPESRASSFAQPTSRKSFDRVPGIQPDGVDCDETPRGRIGRAMSMVHPHPKLLVLPSNPQTLNIVVPKAASISGASGATHGRLRSLTLSSTKTHRQRSESTASRVTVAGFEHHPEMVAKSPSPVHHRGDELLTRALLASRRGDSFKGDGRVPFGFGSASSSPAITLTTADSAEFGLLRTRELTLSPPTTPAEPSSASPNYAIDFLSSQLIPRLLPGTKVGKETPVGSEHAPLPPRRPAEPSSRTTGSLSSLGQMRSSLASRNRNTRNLSLPGMAISKFSKSDDERSPVPINDVAWIEIDTKDATPIQSITDVVRGKTNDKSLRRRSWKDRDRTSKAWDLVEENEAASGTSTGTAFRPVAQEEPPKMRRRSQPTLPSFTEGEELETEVLDDRDDFADVESGDEAAQAELDRYQRATSPLPLLSPSNTTSFFPRRPSPTPRLNAESVVLRGSQVVDNEDDDDEIAVIQCATVRPISRVSSDENSFSSNYSLCQHSANGSVGSMRTFGSSQERSITSQGFANVMEGRTWHAREDSSGISSSDESGPDPEPAPRRFSLRPLTLLAQRDANRAFESSAGSDQESDSSATKQKTSRRGSAGSADRRWSLQIVPPPIPDTIEEADEDKKSGTSGTPTPRASRQRHRTPVERTPVATAEETRRMMQHYVPDTPMSSTPPPSTTVTPPAPYSPDAHITTRRHQRRAAVDENRAPAPKPNATSARVKLPRWPVVEATGSAQLNIRSIR
ncbi:hypothetical protein RQP46_005895 [Phenoliferia psychrophenolica]